MREAAAIEFKAQQLYLSGELTFKTVKALWQASLPYFEQASAISCNFSKVSACDSAGLALLIEWIRTASEKNKTLRFIQLPQQLEAIAEPAGLNDLLAAYS